MARRRSREDDTPDDHLHDYLRKQKALMSGKGKPTFGRREAVARARKDGVPKPGDQLVRAGEAGMEAWCTECEQWVSYTVFDGKAGCDICGEMLTAAWPPDGSIVVGAPSSTAATTSRGSVNSDDRLYVIDFQDGTYVDYPLSAVKEAIKAYRELESGLIIRGQEMQITYSLEAKRREPEE